MSHSINLADFVHALPLIVVALWACLVLLATALGGHRGGNLGPLSVIGLLLGLAVTLWSWIEHPEPAVGLFSSMLIVDRFALFFDALFLIGATLSVLISAGYLKCHRFAEGEYYGQLMLTVAGMMLLVHADDFVVLVIGLETMSLAVYSLVACWGGKRSSAEAGIKYFVMGAVASAFLLYGIALIYGSTGLTGLRAIAGQAETVAGEPLFVLGMLMIVGALAFKIALVPFHMWAPDAYEGAPTPVTGFMAAAVKAAGFGVTLRVLLGVFGADFFAFGSTGWVNILWTLSAVTMTVGNLVALRQNNIKRMLAYSSVAHAGYLMIGVLAAAVTREGASAVLFYLLQYGLATIGAFGVVSWVGSRSDDREQLEDWAGLAGRHPLAAVAMTLFMASLGGIPPTGGFFGKLMLFKAAIDDPGLLLLVFIAAANSVVSVFYYLRPVVAMYFRKSPEGEEETAPLRSTGVTLALVLAAAAVLILGLMPGAPVRWAAASALF